MLLSNAPVRKESSTLAIPAGYVEVPCSQCSAALVVPRRLSTFPVCDSCCRTVRLVNALFAGEAPFTKLDSETRRRYMRRIRPGNAAVLANHADCKPLADEGPELPGLHYAWDGEAPDAATRDDIESRDEHPLAGMFEADFDG